VAAVLGGDKLSYAELYDRYTPLIRAICYDTTRNLTDAQDLAQEVFLRAYEKLGELRDTELFSRWLIGISRMCCKEWLRGHLQLRKHQTTLEPENLETKEISNDGQIEELRSAITKLPEKERLALHAFYLQENSVEDACRTLDMSKSGFYRILDRARKRLAKLMQSLPEDKR